MNFQVRLHTSEQLDNLSLSGIILYKTLGSLRLVNTLFGNHRQLTRAVLDYCSQKSETEFLKIVDLGCGGGDSAFKIYNRLNEEGIKVSILGIDGNQESIKYANSKYGSHEHINFKTADVLDNSFVIPDCDIIVSSHFIYHFKDDELVNFIQKVQQKGIKHLIFSELKRSKIAYLLFKISSFILPISDMAKKDGLIAIRRAFTEEELDSILNKARVKRFKIYKKFWFRTLTKIDLY
ncbi:methyltransferase domain-containing protein [Aquimarina litoralis]|uniref:methyltransferase domain-containing protein n=1 Tax=Aquimarina litoralis TaxID=584605 RepID=UPI001C59B40B|nr:methyltransferase domain-containing protein [Aquimarina litoralis]